MVVLITIIGVLGIIVILYTKQDKFGKSPKGARLERIKQSPNFKKGKLLNLSETKVIL